MSSGSAQGSTSLASEPRPRAWLSDSPADAVSSSARESAGRRVDRGARRVWLGWSSADAVSSESAHGSSGRESRARLGSVVIGCEGLCSCPGVGLACRGFSNLVVLGDSTDRACPASGRARPRKVVVSRDIVRIGPRINNPRTRPTTAGTTTLARRATVARSTTDARTTRSARRTAAASDSPSRAEPRRSTAVTRPNRPSRAGGGAVRPGLGGTVLAWRGAAGSVGLVGRCREAPWMRPCPSARRLSRQG